MPQPNVLNHGAGFLPHFDELKCVPLTDRELERLYALTDWRGVLLDEHIKETYHDFFTVSLFKALALPYLIPIPSELALARELAERELLQTLCGFWGGRTPTRATFWHFRRKYSAVYPDLMLRVLIALVLSGSEPNLALPFVTPIPQAAGVPHGHYSAFRLDIYRPLIEVWTTVPEAEVGRPIVTAGKTWAELHGEVRERKAYKRQRSPRKRGLAGGLGLPAEARAELYNGEIVHFGIDKPEWLDFWTKQVDTLTTVGPASFRPYTACHVLVIREHENRRQVLLSRRVAGFGKGQYGLPGGKKRPEESLQKCAKRELLEETGIHILKSRPVSWHRTRLPGKPEVYSVGVLAEEYEGEPQHIEPSQNAEWGWFDLADLPMPLFEPTYIVVYRFIKGKYPNLQWSDVEAHVSESEESLRQLPLPI